MLTVKEYLTNSLVKNGVEHIFGVPADFVLEFFQHAALSRIDVVRMNDEPHAGYAADAYARLKGLGVVVITYGAGGFKLVNSTAQAYVEDSPVLVISGAPASYEYLRGQDLLHYRIHHVVKGIEGQRKVFEQVTGMAERIDDVHTARSQIDNLIEFIRSQKQPGYLEIPRDMWGAAIPKRDSYERTHYQPPQSSARPLTESLAGSVRLMDSSKKPVMWIGTDIHRFGLNEVVNDIAIQTDIPFCTTLFGKSAIDERKPMHLGVYVGAQTASFKYDDDAVREYVESSDCVIMLGINFSDFNFGIGTVHLSGSARLINAQKKYVRIDSASYEGVLLEDFVRGLARSKLSRHDFIEPPPETPFSPPGPKTPINSDIFFGMLNHYIEEDTIIVSDIGDCLFGAGKLDTSFARFLAPGVYGSMGWSVSASLGAALAERKLRPFVIVGDGAFLMGQESVIGKLAELDLAPVIFILNNQGYATLQGVVEGEFNRLPMYDFEKLAAVYGGMGFRVETTGELKDALRQVKKISSQPVIINLILPAFGKTTTLKKVSNELVKGVACQDE
jgi:TPP-dependent 2-oxoacid decarboxylase